jgi:hypothetical protein
LTKRLVLALLGSTSQAACSAWHRVFDTVKIGPFRLPVSRIAGEPDALVCLELDKFEEAGADRMLPNVARRDIAGIDRPVAAADRRQDRRLRPSGRKAGICRPCRQVRR